MLFADRELRVVPFRRLRNGVAELVGTGTQQLSLVFRIDEKDMKRPPALTDSQKRRLNVLEPALRQAVKLGKYERAKLLTHEIQDVLRPTGHETRLMQAKNWLFEAALESGNLEFAISGFQGVRKKAAPSTRLYLEATALLAVCYLRKKDLKSARPLMEESLDNLRNISSERQRRKLRSNLVKRFEEEGMIAALSQDVSAGSSLLNVEEIHRNATVISQTKSNDEIIMLLGESTPTYVIDFLKRVSDESRKLLPYKEILLLPSGETNENHLNLGKKVFASLKRIIWKSLCDPESDVYKLWYSDGVKAVLDKKYLTGSIVAAFSGYRIGIYALAVHTSAIVLKTGIEVFCDVYQPPPIMGARE